MNEWTHLMHSMQFTGRELWLEATPLSMERQEHHHTSFTSADGTDNTVSPPFPFSQVLVLCSTKNAEKATGALERSCLFIFNARERGHENLESSLQPSIKNKSCCQRPKVLRSRVIKKKKKKAVKLLVSLWWGGFCTLRECGFTWKQLKAHFCETCRISEVFQRI